MDTVQSRAIKNTNHRFRFFISRLDIVTCVALDSCGWYMISGSRDCTSVVWDVSNSNNTNPKPFQTLLGHDLPITCVAIATELDMAVSGSQDGTVNVYSIHQGLLVHCLTPLGCVSPPSIISYVTISFQGHIAFSAKDKVRKYRIDSLNVTLCGLNRR